MTEIILKSSTSNILVVACAYIPPVFDVVVGSDPCLCALTSVAEVSLYPVKN